MNTLKEIYESKTEIKKAVRSLVDFNVYGIAEISNPVSDALLAKGEDKLNEQWLKKTNTIRNTLFELEDWIKKNVKG
jgi:hypothetical protein